MFESFVRAIIRFSVRINKGFLMVTGCNLVTYIGCCHHDPLLQSISTKLRYDVGNREQKIQLSAAPFTDAALRRRHHLGGS